ncbi:ABC transporter, permease protein [[Clostridium] methylpentosum DSM 5476]|jgi:arginine/lysine/histidine transport system permease protein|uniref:ABC transporter, permease protein n=1 Tax=[Clostridium] methylpentosum DSM 5476 TaxID=537013 RepID=C0E9Q5_9FIRM|nr:ABC transporter, permease protein [[Clostridium] methylpentosum DSM 5476]MDY3990099.1 amino acid ABC transporter permease [Massilioclostridium sp.]MEE1492267.1 amino acid ABC transporter permease [Massilioclostridium sp.]
MGFIDSFVDKFQTTFIVNDRWLLFLDGFKVTIIMAVFATLLGVIIGTIVAIAKVYSFQTGKLKILDKILSVYLTVFRGTPIVVQLMIWYFIILTSVDNGVLVAIIAFGINSGAYVAEIVRAGILAIDKGQTEAGRSLGLSSGQTMKSIILPQAFKNILPALGNELIALLKETSVVGYVAVVDLTKVGDLVRSRTMDAVFPLLAVALVYLLLVIGLTAIQKRIERRLRQGDRR